MADTMTFDKITRDKQAQDAIDAAKKKQAQIWSQKMDQKAAKDKAKADAVRFTPGQGGPRVLNPDEE